MLSRLISVAAAALGMVVAGVIFAPASAHAAGPGIVGGLLGSTESSPVPSTTGEPALGELVAPVVEAAGVATMETPAGAETSLAGTSGVVAETATGATDETSTTAETSLPPTVGSVLEAATGDTGAAESPIGSAVLTEAVAPIVSSFASEVVAPVASTLAAPITSLGANDIEPVIAALGPIAAPAPEDSVPGTSNPPAPVASGSSPSTNPIDEQTAVQLPLAVDVGEWAPSPAPGQPVHPVAPRAPGQPGAPTTPRADSVSPAAAAATLPRFGVTQSSLRPANPSLPSPSTNSSDEGTGAANLQGVPLPSPLPPLGSFLTTFGQSSAASAALVSLIALAALALLGTRWNAGALVPHSRSYAPPVPPG